MFGLGLRYPHHQYVLNDKPKIDFFEIHSENFIAKGGGSHYFLEQICQHYPLSFHCVGLSLGSSSGVSKKHADNIKLLIDKFQPILISDHISWTNYENLSSNDLLPLPYTQESLAIFCDNVKYVQDLFGRNILLENPSSYLEFNQSTFAEVDFINQILANTDAELLLDLNNVFVTCENFGLDAKQYLDNLDITKTQEIHLAGHSVYEKNNMQIRIDSHNDFVSDGVIDLFKYLKGKLTRSIPTLLEWDSDIPEFPVLASELNRIRSVI